MELLEAMHALGYRKVITTPHSMADGYRNPTEVILGGLEKLRAEVARVGLDIRVEAAAEYYLDHELERKVAAGDVLTFGNKLLLFELPFISEPNMLLQVIFQMQTQGYRPVLAHPERYAFWYTDFSKYERLKERGVLFQLNLVALSGAYGPQARQIAERLIDAGAYELLGSDCHNMNHVEAIRNTLTRPYLHKLIASGKLLNSTL
jgi:tyrosine-protein phosphatase YwqE